jgi:hypothetical protein
LAPDQRQLRSWTRINPRSPILPILKAIFEHFLPAGPLFGVLATMYRYHLVQTASLRPNPATHEILRQIQVSHGHVLGIYYITPGQNALWWALSVPALVWLVGGILTLVVLGIRAHYAEKRS